LISFPAKELNNLALIALAKPNSGQKPPTQPYHHLTKGHHGLVVF
jgi:hypothetical protein